MATRQYIGARYVPKFYTNSVDGSAAWESNVVYEPLIYVTLTNGHMYISKKQVPATVGTPASNAEYWLDVGSYNGFIDELQQQINDLITDVNAKANMVGIAPVEDGNNTVGNYTAGDEFYRNGVLYKAKTTIAANTAFSSLVLNTDYEAAPTVSSEITALTNDMAKAEKAIDTTDPIIFIGDSYADGATEFIAQTITELSLTNATNLAYSGDGFTWDMALNTSGNGFLRQLQGYTGDKTTIKHIYVCGGLNDAQSTAMSALATNIAVFRAYANINYPNAKLHLVYTGSALDGYPLNYGRTFEYRNKAKYIYSQADGFDYHDISGYLEVISTNIGSDGVHPSTDGQTALKNALVKLLLNMPNEVLYPYTRVGISASGSGSTISRIDYCIKGNVLSLFFADNWSVKVPANTAITGDLLEVGTLSNMYFNRALDIIMGCRADKFNSKNFQNAVMLIRFFQDKIYVASKQVKSDNTGIETFTANLGDGFIVLPGQMEYAIEASTVN